MASNTRKSIFFDVTHLIGWKGNLTGIPRTTDEIARRLLDYTGVEFISWDSKAKQFITIDMQHYYDEVEPKNRAYFKNKSVLTEGQKLQPRPLHKRIIRRMLYELPVLARLATLVKKRLIDRDSETSLAHPDYKVIGIPKMTAGDMLCIPCGVWDDKKYIQAVRDEKKNKVLISFICYDLLPIVVPQFSGQWGKPMSMFTRDVTAICDLVFAISEHTKTDLQKWLDSEKIPAPRIEVMKLGDAFNQSDPVVPRSKAFVSTGLDTGKQPFILCTGTVEARKNHTLLYYTYKLAKSRGIELPRLIIVGRHGHRTENIIDFMHDDPDVNEKITMLFDTNDGELSWLYQHCTFTIYPSFYEGWGLPIAESIAQGVPCISSNTSSMTEVAQGFVDYFSPYSPEDCLRAIQEYMDPQTYKKVKARTAGYKLVVWDDSFADMRTYIRSISKDLLAEKKS